MLDLPFEADPKDHIETSKQSLEDISLTLEILAKQFKKNSKKELSIYDPYYCGGKIVRNLKELGFDQVHNKCDDFNKVLKDKKVPSHDVVVSMPPLSEEGIQKCLKFCIRNDKPWFLLLPYYVYKLDYYKILVESSKMRPFYIVPHDEYEFETPAGDSVKLASFWHIELGKENRSKVLEELKSFEPGPQFDPIHA